MTRMTQAFPLALAAAFAFSACEVAAQKSAEPKTYSLASLNQDIAKLEKKEITLVGTVIGVCKSGCKMWIADPGYKKGDPKALVRAKDDAFKFERGTNGRQVVLHGYAVAKYLDYCAKTGKEHEGPMEDCEGPDGHEKGDHKHERKVQDVTFFATKVEYR